MAASITRPASFQRRFAARAAERARNDMDQRDVMLTGMAYLLGMQGDGADLIALRDKLIPDGMESVNQTYRAESGQAAQLAARIGPMVGSLESIVVGPNQGAVSLKAFTDEWIGIGDRLGKLEDEKGRLQAAPERVPAGEQLDARNVWVRSVNHLESCAQFAGLDDTTMAEIFGPLWAAVRTAERRGGPRKGGSSDSGSGPNIGGTPV